MSVRTLLPKWPTGSVAQIKIKGGGCLYIRAECAHAAHVRPDPLTDADALEVPDVD